MTTKTATDTRRHVLLAIRNGQPEIVEVGGLVSTSGAWGRIIDRHAELQSEADAQGVKARELHYAVRDSDHELVQAAAQAEASKLGKAQAKVLKAVAESTRQLGRSWVKPGDRKMNSRDSLVWGRVTGVYSADATAPARKLAAKGYLTISGLDFAPKTYTMTSKGRIIAAAL